MAKNIQQNNETQLEEGIKVETVEAEKLACSMVMDERDEYVKMSQGEREIWKKSYDHYIGKQRDRNDTWVNSCFIPKTQQATEGIVSYILSSEPKLETEAESSGGDMEYEQDKEKAKLEEQLMNFVWRKRMNMAEILDIYGKQGVLFGTGITKVIWETQYDVVTKRDEVYEKDDKKMNVTYDDAKAYVIDIFDFYTDPYCPIKDSRSNICRYEYFPSELVALGYEKAKNLKPGSTDQGTSGMYASSRSVDETDTNYSGYSRKNTKVEVFERWGLLKRKTLTNLGVSTGGDEDEEIETVVTVAKGENGDVLLRAIENPYDGKRPFFPFYYRKNPLPGRAYGLGIGHSANHLQSAINNTANMMLDNMILANNPPFMRRRGARIDPRQLVLKPAGYIDMDDTGDLRTIEIQDIRSSAYQLYQTLDSEFQMTTAMTNSQKGMGQGYNTATELTIMTQSATTLIKKVQQNLESAMSQMADFIKYLYAKNMTQSRSITIFDPRTQQNLVKMITPEDIKGNTSTRVKADSTLQMNQAVLMKLIGDGWRMFANVQDPVETAKMYYDIGGVNDTTKLFPPPAPPAPQGPGQPGAPQEMSPGQNAAAGGQMVGGLPPLPQTGELLTPQAMTQAIRMQQPSPLQ